jgi:hypothetical protein
MPSIKKGEKRPEHWLKAGRKSSKSVRKHFKITEENAEEKPTSKLVNTLLCQHYKSNKPKNDESTDA